MVMISVMVHKIMCLVTVIMILSDGAEDDVKPGYDNCVLIRFNFTVFTAGYLVLFYNKINNVYHFEYFLCLNSSKMCSKNLLFHSPLFILILYIFLVLLRPGSNQQRGDKGQPPAVKVTTGEIPHRIRSLFMLPSPGYCTGLTAVKGNIKNEGLARKQVRCETKNRGFANHPAF